MTSREWLTVINHNNIDSNEIFVFCDASNLCLGVVLTYEELLETVCPVAFKSQQFSGAELNYLVHEKELLAIVCTLCKWRMDLLGVPFMVFSDHRTLENFSKQKHLSHRQAQWQEFLLQYNYKIVYIAGKNNTPADTMSRKPMQASTEAIASISALHVCCDEDWLVAVKDGYAKDTWRSCLLQSL